MTQHVTDGFAGRAEGKVWDLMEGSEGSSFRAGGFLCEVRLHSLAPTASIFCTLLILSSVATRK
jgi:hypothetical protein